MKLPHLTYCVVLMAASCLPNAHAASGPAGIYVIGDTRDVAGEVEKFDFDYVAGYTLRIPWTNIETWNATTQSPEYNFTRMDTRLEELRAKGKKMTLEIFVNKAPTYLFDPPGISTWTNPHPTQGGVQPLPWDARTLAAYQAMMQALANHPVAGTPWRVADHPSLESVDAPIVGPQGIRELSNTLINLQDCKRCARGPCAQVIRPRRKSPAAPPSPASDTHGETIGQPMWNSTAATFSTRPTRLPCGYGIGFSWQ